MSTGAASSFSGGTFFQSSPGAALDPRRRLAVEVEGQRALVVAPGDANDRAGTGQFGQHVLARRVPGDFLRRDRGRDAVGAGDGFRVHQPVDHRGGGAGGLRLRPGGQARAVGRFEHAEVPETNDAPVVLRPDPAPQVPVLQFGVVERVVLLDQLAVDPRGDHPPVRLDDDVVPLVRLARGASAGTFP